MRFHHLYSDDDGVTHFDDARFDFRLQDFAPPAPPMYATEPAEATRYVMLELPAGWVGETHPSPRRQLYFGMAGVLEVIAGDGETRRIGPGDAWLMEDTTGPGHHSHVVGDELVRAVIVQLE
jgi:quercetin dioxygenase-like cupin family protein